MVARQKQQHRGEPVEGVAAFEQAHTRPVIEVQDAPRLAEQLVLAHLEEFVAGMVFDQGLQALFVVAAGRHAGPGQDVGDLLADQRHGAGRLIIGLGGEQADEADLAIGLAGGVVAFDADVIHVAAAVHPRPYVGFGDGQRRVAEQPILDLAQQDRRFVGAAQHGARGVAQHAQAVLGLVERLFRRIVPVLQARIFVDPGAEEDELIGLQPAEEGHFLGGGAPGVQLQFGDGLAHQFEHRREIVHGGAHVLQGRGYAPHQGLLAVRADRIEDHLDHRFAPDDAGHAALAGAIALDLDDRMEQRAHRQALLGDLAHDRIDQEGGVVLDDLQPVEAARRQAKHRGDADRRTSPAPALAKAPEIGKVLRQIGVGKLGQFVGLGVGGGLVGEGADADLRRVASQRGDDGLGQGRGRGGGHAAHRTAPA